ncbi:hypothetical protein E2C01_008314 [Portunus trituberculatus]|uniref:Uncharacterized protein n=1 Tax=Portunus trituberculatus TaxID=210409 RepID=A0A5B7D2T3_PORTR|nr:hypothetical protein [Portunus trituberculatus]
MRLRIRRIHNTETKLGNTEFQHAVLRLTCVFLKKTGQLSRLKSPGLIGPLQGNQAALNNNNNNNQRPINIPTPFFE